MRKFTFFISSLLLMGLSLKAQTIQHSTFNVDSLFQLLDTSLISTGILMDKVPSGINLKLYDGTCNDCVLPPETFKQTLLNFERASLQQPSFLDAKQEQYKQHLANNKPIPIQIANIRYNKIKEYALDSNLIDTAGGLLQEGDITTESPYHTNRFVGLAVPAELRPQGLSFTLDSSFYFSNDNAALTQVQIDLGDGQGYQTLTFGQSLTPQYGELTDPALEIGLKLTIGGQTYTSRAKMTLALCGSGNIPAPVAPPWSTASQFQFGNLVAEETYNPNGHATGNVYVHYRSNPEPGTENQFKKPLIVVEGIDFEPYNQQNASNHQMGQFGWCALWGEDMDNYPQLAKMQQLLSDYHAEDYDIIMLDFKDGATDIKENAYLLQTLIKKVNQNKTTDAEANVIIGASMGAIVSRYALADMEADGIDHCTRLFLSFDGPHRGANIPLGAQYAIEFFATNSIEQFSKAREFLFGSLSRKAAQQLLIYQLHTTWENEHNLFFAELNTLGYPQQCKNTAIASGSGISTNQGYLGGTKLVEYDYTGSSLLGLEGDLHIWALPGRSSDNLIFHGQVAFFDFNYNPVLGYLFGPLIGSLGTSWGSEEMKVYVSPALPHYDNAPGGIRQVAKELAEIDTDGKGDIDALEFDQSFVSTISALDINTSDLFFNVQLAVDNGTIQTPFDEVYFPDNNTFHVEATDGSPPSRGDNITFAKTKVKLGQAVSSPVLTSTYNYGEELNNTVSHTLVINNGKLHLYGDFNDSRSGQTPNAGKTHVYRLGNGCSTEDLTIEQGGELIIGDAAANNKAEFIISGGSSLTLGNNGTLKIKEGSKLIIEDGANFTFEDGASIQLQGPNAELVIQGKLTLGANTTFTHSGNGKIIFDQQVYKDDGTGNMHLAFGDYMEIGANAKLDLSGPGGTPPFTKKLVEVRKPVYFVDGNNNTFEEVDFRYGAIDLAPSALMYIYGKTNFHSVTVNSTGGGKHGGIRIWNSNGAGALFSNCNFSNGQFGVMADWLGGGPAIQIRNSHFTNNTTGISVNGGNFQITNNQFNNNGLAIIGSALSGTSTVGTCQITGGNSGWLGIGLFSQNGALVNISNSTIKDHLNARGYGIDMVGVGARITCSELRNNDIGINLWDGILYLDEDAGNEFINNTVGIQYDGSATETGIYLFEGQNKFDLGTNGSWYISGRTQGGGLLSTYFNATTVDADFNEMPMQHSSATGWTFPVRLGINHVPNALGLSVQNNFQNNTGCNNPVINLEHPMLTPVAIESGAGGEGPSSIGNFKTGLTNAIYNITFDENEAADLTAYLDLMDLLEATFTNKDASYKALRHMAIGASMSALGNSFQYEHLVHAEGGAVLAEVQRFIDILDNELDSLSDIDSNDHSAIFRYTLNKTQVYRVAGNYSEALALFGNYTNWTFNNTQSMRAQYWECICDAEKQLYDETIGIEDFGYLTEQCDINFAGFNYKRAPETNEGSGIPVEILLSNVSLYPQPVNEKLTIQFSGGFNGASDYTIFNNSGQLVLQDKIVWKGTSIEQINLSTLPIGLYFITLDFDELGQKTYKITKE